MDTCNSNHGNRKHRNKPDFRAAALLLGIYTALYLAVAGLVHFMTSPDAAAAIFRISPAATAAATHGPVQAIGTPDASTAARPFDAAAKDTDDSRVCELGPGTRSNCTFN